MSRVIIDNIGEISVATLEQDKLHRLQTMPHRLDFFLNPFLSNLNQ
jgi:hypothetical protein